MCINSSANFLFYLFYGAKFRTAFRETFFAACRKWGGGRGGCGRRREEAQEERRNVAKEGQV